MNEALSRMLAWSAYLDGLRDGVDGKPNDKQWSRLTAKHDEEKAWLARQPKDTPPAPQPVQHLLLPTPAPQPQPNPGEKNGEAADPVIGGTKITRDFLAKVVHHLVEDHDFDEESAREAIGPKSKYFKFHQSMLNEDPATIARKVANP